MPSILLLFAAVIGAVLAMPTAGTAASYPWCAHYGFDLDGTNCGFVSFDQCMAALSGNGGYCIQNSQYQPPAGHPAPRRARRLR
jgi:hypothetical protein